MSFAHPIVLLALLALPLLGLAYLAAERRRRRAGAVFAVPLLLPSVAPVSPRWRRHIPLLVLAIAGATLILAAARPQRTVAVALSDGAVILANDTSSSMLATDVSPSRLGAAKAAAAKFLQAVPATIRVGLLEFTKHPTLLQSPTTDHAVTEAALAGESTGGGTALGDAVDLALRVLGGLREPGTTKRPPSAIVMLSDGASNAGSSPYAAARAAAAAHIPVYTVALGTATGKITIRHRRNTSVAPVPVQPQELAEVARLSGGRTYTIATVGALRTVYAHLAQQFGHHRVRREETAHFAGGALVLLLVAGTLSLRWFGRLIP